MLARIEIDGFKSFENFKLDLSPFTAIVGPNASGKSNLLEAIQFLSNIVREGVEDAARDIRGVPSELFRRTPGRRVRRMSFAVEAELGREVEDDLGNSRELAFRRVRYEVRLGLGLARKGGGGLRPYVAEERCFAIVGKARRKTVMLMERTPRGPVTLTDGPVERRNLTRQRSAISSIQSADFAHLFAMRDLLGSVKVFHVNPAVARRPSDIFAPRTLLPDASNLATVLVEMRDDTRTAERPDGVLADVSADLAMFVRKVSRLVVRKSGYECIFALETTDGLKFDARVISDGTVRLIALLALLNDPVRGGLVCLEEPENGIHEGRIPDLVRRLREVSRHAAERPPMQIILNTHSPAILTGLRDEELVAADLVSTVKRGSTDAVLRTRMRRAVSDDDEACLARVEIERLLRRPEGAA